MANYKKIQERRIKEEEATAFAFQEFINTFQSTTPVAKTFIKSGVYNPGNTQNMDPEDKGQLYMPMSLQKTHTKPDIKALECARILKDNRLSKPGHQNGTKPKSNLEQLKEEIQMRHKNAHMQKTKNKDADSELDTTTNLFLTHLNPKLNEDDLMQIFGVHGPLASVKIMWPRMSERNRNSNIGFVAFMSRKDSERAFLALSGRPDMRISWGKPIDIPHQPIYIPPEMVKALMPPPYSGLPFNAQPRGNDTLNDEEVDLSETIVRVTIPMDRKVLCLIHRTIEFVIREGPMFEASIMHKEINNPLYQFLFDNKSAPHIYYRWKLFSIMNGESTLRWSMKPFRMFDGGSIWLPPIAPDFKKGMDVKVPVVDLKRLSDGDQARLVEVIQQLTPQRSKISEAMVFCLGKLQGSRDIVGILSESFNSTSLKHRGTKQIARLYLVSDILYNSRFKQGRFGDLFERKLPGIFRELLKTLQGYSNIADINLSNAMKTRIMKVLRAWEMWRLFNPEFLNQLESIIFPLHRDETEAISTSNLLNLNSVDPSFEEVVPVEEEPVVDVYANFIKSKWETLDPNELEAQAMSTQKLREYEMERKLEEKRKRVGYLRGELEKQSNLSYDDLRKVEMKVIRFQDDLECGQRRTKYGNSIEDEVNEYRKRCIAKLRSRDASSSSSKRHRKY